MGTERFTVRLVELSADSNRITDAEYSGFAEWWKKHGWTAPPQSVLPKLGVVVMNENKGLAAGWLYMDNSVGVAMMEWVVTNPDNSPRASLKSIALLVETLCDLAKTHQYATILTGTNNRGLIRLYQKLGFEQTDSGITHMVLTLA